MKPEKIDLYEDVRRVLQLEATRICKLYQLRFDLEVGELRSEESYFKGSVWVRERKAPMEHPPLELVRSILATVEQNTEEKYQGLRLMLLPLVKKKTVVRQRKAS